LIVHQAAVQALDRFDLPEEYDGRAKAALSSLIVYYANERPTDDFLQRVPAGLNRDSQSAEDERV
jgi:hypothetical protein